MSAPVVIRASSVGKRFQRVHEKPMLLRDMALLLSTRRKSVDEFWALREVSFEVRQGETLGILGPNGSGKSTLLTLLAGTAFPSEGTASTRGRVSLLLELGAGFSPDMTGEENIIVNAGLLGLTTSEARSRMKELVDFAELGDVIDTPIRHYSSGMMARLGFSIAIHVSPDVLIVDEVLAVGDIRFQEKCNQEFGRLRSDGVTIVLVSQSPEAIADRCDRAIWLKEGRVQSIGDAREVADQYRASMQ
jgi:ABC-type polysaccharide/polyol phosphate transport system ATPase subunit